VPWRLVQFILIFAVFLLFVMFNLENRSDINLGFTRFENVPVFITAFFSFILGTVITIPLAFGLWLKKRKPDGQKKKGRQSGGSANASSAVPEGKPVETKDYGID